MDLKCIGLYNDGYNHYHDSANTPASFCAISKSGGGWYVDYNKDSRFITNLTLKNVVEALVSMNHAAAIEYMRKCREDKINGLLKQ